MGSITVRLPDELHERLKDHATGAGVTASAMVVTSIQTVLDGGAQPDTDLARAHAEIVANLTADRDRWRKLAQAMQPIADTKPVKRGSDPMGRREHAAGPVLASAVPDVPGTVSWSGLKAKR